MTFDHFGNFMNALGNMSGDGNPPFIIVKDLFNYFDSKRDGYVDLNEWMETFKRIEVPIKSDHLMHIVLNPNGQAYSKFEQTPEYDIIMKAVARNRKFLIEQF
jgi:Ca2+-binding EF-hand superfamily protein